MKKLLLVLTLSICSFVMSYSQETNYFPLSTFNKDIWNPNKYASFDAETGAFIADQYGFGGWKSDTPLDLSGYKYLVMNFNTDPAGTAASLRVFDENSYWVLPARATFVTATQAVIDLTSVHKTNDAGDTDNGALNPANIYIVGVWTLGWSGVDGAKNNAVSIKDCYVTNNEDYSRTTTGIDLLNNDENKLVDVYTLLGVRIRSKVLEKQAIRGLTKGLYLIGNKKVLVTDNTK
ncbi:MAG: hypothetical protein Q8909_06430 [Bacteroidota bacterium]|nr:hypothetical protein [Bacteroidota bacterium]